MKFEDMYTSHKDRFSVGVERESGLCYLSIPVSNGVVEYEEYYEIDKSLCERLDRAFAETRAICEKSRARLNDDKLMEKPGKQRGSPV
jgi:hypothetical protein